MRETLSGNITKFRKERGLTQKELGRVMCISSQAVSKWETGSTMPDIAVLPKLAEVLGVSTDKLLGYDAYKTEASNWEEEYKKDGYFWGIKPSIMCIKLLELLPPT